MDETTPTLATTRSVFYRRFIFTGSAGNPAFTVGSELSIMAGSASIAYGRASIDIDSDNVPFCVAVRYTSTGSTVACAIGVVAGNLAGANIDTDITGVSIASPDVSLSTAHISSNWFMGINSGGTFWLTKATGPNVGLSSITFSALMTLSTNTVHHAAIVGRSNGQVHIGFTSGTVGFVGGWNDLTSTQLSTVTVINSAQRVAMAHNETDVWMFFIQRISAKQVAGYARQSTNWGTAIVSTHASETWDWPNAVLRIDDAQLGAFVWSTAGLTPNKIYLSAAVNVTQKTVSDTGLATESLRNTRPAFDLSTVLDTINIKLNLTDTLSGVVESATKAISPKVFDTALATELIRQGINVSETRLGTDVAGIKQATADSATGTDVASQKNLNTAADSGTGTESIVFGPSLNESVSAIDTITRLSHSISELVTVVDSVGIKINLSDAFTASDIQRLSIILTEEVVAVELLNRIIEVLETATATEIIDQLKPLVTDSATATDLAKLDWNLSDSGVAVDTTSKVVQAVSVLLRLLINKQRLKLEVK